MVGPGVSQMPSRRTCVWLAGLLLWTWLGGLCMADELSATSLKYLEKPIFVLVPDAEPIATAEETTLRCLLVGRDGLPVREDPSATVKVDQGKVLRFDRSPEGIFEIRYRAPDVVGRDLPKLEIRAVLGKDSITDSFPIQVLARQQGTLTMSLRSNEARLGRDTEVKFVVEGRRPDGQPILAQDVSILTNVGQVERLRTARPGRVEGYFMPRNVGHPQIAVIAAFVGEGSDQFVAWEGLRIIGTPEVPVRTEPGTTVWIEVNGRRFGPRVAGDSALVMMPVEVPPGVHKLVVNAKDTAGNTTRSSIDPGIPSFPRALLHIDRESFRSDEREPLLLTLIVVQEDGTPSALPAAQIETSGGRLGGLVEMAPGTFRSTYFPPLTPGMHEIRVRLPIPGETEQIYTATVEVREGTPTRAELKVTPSVLRADDPPAEVTLRVLDKAGNLTPVTRPEAKVDFGTIGQFRAIGPGEYVAAFRPRANLESQARDASGAVMVPIVAWVERIAGDGPPERIEISPGRRVVKAGGGPVDLEVLALDRWGDPVRGVPLTAVVETGDGSLSQAQVTDGNGRADFQYQPGFTLGPVVVLLKCDEGGPVGRALLLQAVEDWEPDALPLRGEAAGNDPTTLTAETSIVVRAGTVKEIQISAMPNVLYSGRGQSSQIRVRLEDHAGNFVVDPTLQIDAGAGTVSGKEVTDGTHYTARYTPPEISRAAVTDVITVNNTEGEYSGSTEIQVYRVEGRFLGTLRIGYLSNLAGISSPMVDIQGLLKLPLKVENIFLGGTLGYYTFTAEGTRSVRYDLFPIHLFGCVRGQSGRFSPYGGLGPILAPTRVRSYLPGSYLDSSDGGSSEQQKLFPTRGLGVASASSDEWVQQKTLALFPGFGGLLGLEVGLGPGGISMELMISWIQGRSVFDDVIMGGYNLGGLSVRVGYVGHF